MLRIVDNHVVAEIECVTADLMYCVGHPDGILILHILFKSTNVDLTAHDALVVRQIFRDTIAVVVAGIHRVRFGPRHIVVHIIHKQRVIVGDDVA